MYVYIYIYIYMYIQCDIYIYIWYHVYIYIYIYIYIVSAIIKNGETMFQSDKGLAMLTRTGLTNMITLDHSSNTLTYTPILGTEVARLVPSGPCCWHALKNTFKCWSLPEKECLFHTYLQYLSLLYAMCIWVFLFVIWCSFLLARTRPRHRRCRAARRTVSGLRLQNLESR